MFECLFDVRIFFMCGCHESKWIEVGPCEIVSSKACVATAAENSGIFLWNFSRLAVQIWMNPVDYRSTEIHICVSIYHARSRMQVHVSAFATGVMSWSSDWLIDVIERHRWSHWSVVSTAPCVCNGKRPSLRTHRMHSTHCYKCRTFRDLCVCLSVLHTGEPCKNAVGPRSGVHIGSIWPIRLNDMSARRCFSCVSCAFGVCIMCFMCIWAKCLK